MVSREAADLSTVGRESEKVGSRTEQCPGVVIEEWSETLVMCWSSNRINANYKHAQVSLPSHPAHV